MTLYEFLTLTRPFEGHTSQEVLNKIVTRNASLPRARNELIPKDLETICLTAMEKDPGRRYQSAGAFGEDLRNFLGFRPIKARPIGLATRTYRMIRRNPAYSALAFLLFLLIVVGPLVLGLQQKLANIEIRKALEQAEEEAATAKQMIEYLEEIFKSSNPLEGRGKQVSAYDLLKRGVARIEDELEDQPRARARLMNVMGNTYMWLGIHDEAEPYLAEALERLDRTPGDHHAYAYFIRLNAAEMYWGLDRLEEAESLFLESVEGYRRILGEDRTVTIRTMDRLVDFYMDEGRFDEAGSMAREALKRTSPGAPEYEQRKSMLEEF